MRKERLAKPGASPEQYKHPFLTSDTGLLDQLSPIATT